MVCGLRHQPTEDEIREMFGHSLRIVNIEFGIDMDGWLLTYLAIVTFSSHSAARKALDSFKLWDDLTLKWMTTEGEITSTVKTKTSSFKYSLFTRDPVNSVFTIPIDNQYWNA